MAYREMADPYLYQRAVRSGLTRWYTVGATLGGASVAAGLEPTGGSITDSSDSGGRRTLNLELAGGPEMYELLSPSGTTLFVTCHVRYTGREVVDIPMGVFDIDRESLSESSGRITLTAPDKWVRVKRARFIKPQSSAKGLPVVNQIASLIRGALGAGEPVTITATSTAKVGALVWEKDRDDAIIKLADNIGAWVYFDRDGVATVADVPTIAPEADWLVDAGTVLTELDRDRDRTETRNVWVVSSSASDGERFKPVYVWDADPNSLTYAGLDPFNNPGSAGPFGIVTGYFDSPILSNSSEAQKAGRTFLARSVGLATQVSLEQAPNPAMDALDVLDVLPPGWKTLDVQLPSPSGFGVGEFGTSPFGSAEDVEPTLPRLVRASTRTIERHVADNVTHPLTLETAQRIDGRSTRLQQTEGVS